MCSFFCWFIFRHKKKKPFDSEMIGMYTTPAGEPDLTEGESDPVIASRRDDSVINASLRDK